MMKDCLPRFLFTSDAALGEAVAKALPPQWLHARRLVLFDEVLASEPGDDADVRSGDRILAQDADLVTIIYTSGTSGEPKGVCLNVGNVTHMLGLHDGAARSADGSDARTGPRFPLSAV